MKTECGIFGCIYPYKNENVIAQTINGLDLLQHRGRESAGIAYWKEIEDENICSKKKSILVTNKNPGLVKDIFSSLLRNYPNFNVNKCIGHVRYSTSGKKINHEDLCKKHIQPLLSETCDESFALAYNGNIKNLDCIGKKYNIDKVDYGEIDTQLIIEIIKKIKKSTLEEKLIEFMKNINGVFCLLIMTLNGIYCLRDSFGVRPLCIGKMDGVGEVSGYCISSESCALQNFKFIREVEPGEILFFGRKKMGDKSFFMKKIFQLKRKSENIQKCIFEHIYFMNKETKTNNKSISDIRFQVGQKIAVGDVELLFNEKSDLSNFLVTGCPQTGIPYGKGYADKSGISYCQFLQKTQNCGRTFILPQNTSRIVSCKKNLFIRGDISGRDLILLDDSLVRGNTITTVIQKLREHGAKSVHIRITSPPVKYPCFFGVDIPTRKELIASSNTIEEIRQKIGADTLSYTSLDTIKDCIGSSSGFCSACFDGQYKKDLLDW